MSDLIGECGILGVMTEFQQKRPKQDARFLEDLRKQSDRMLENCTVKELVFMRHRFSKSDKPGSTGTVAKIDEILASRRPPPAQP